VNFQLRQLLLGKPLKTDLAHHARLPILLALPIFASDALSSVAYATEQILVTFSGLGLQQSAYPVALGISIAIVSLILMVVISYREVINAYPKGGGSYVVARENLGLAAGLIAASALLVDYVLTVAVSIADCVAQTNSALHQFGPQFEHLTANKVLVGSLLVLAITLINLRGAKESGAVFAGPSYGFIAIIATMIVWGLIRVKSGLAPMAPVHMHPNPQAVKPLDWLVLVRGFASGCAALTGIEAVSNGVQAFKAPESRNANTTLAILGGILAFMFIGITYLATHFHIGPSHSETVVSQIARAVFGLNPFYYLVQIFTALILFLAANTAFSGFPRLAGILAEDNFLPRQLASIGDRLSYNNGIILLGLAAVGFLVVFGGEAHALLPLYTIGVFIAFSTAQIGMVARGIRLKTGRWVGITINLIGGTVTSVVLVVVALTKFIARDQPPLFGIKGFYEGAWMALLLMALVYWFFTFVNRHYTETDRQLAQLPPTPLHDVKHTVIVLVPSRFHYGVVTALNYARSISADAMAVHIAFDREKAERLEGQWVEMAGTTPLVVLDSPYRSLVGPLMRYLDAAADIRDDDIVTVVLPEFVPAKWWHNFLHNASGWLLRLRLHYRDDIVVVSVRYKLG
jgi:amino acid transporter